MRIGARWLALAFACFALSLAADAQSMLPFDLDFLHCNFTFSGTSTAGPIVGNPSNTLLLIGTQNVDLTLQSGAQPFAALAFSGGGNVRINSPLHGKINDPSSPLLPPLFIVDVNDLWFSASSPSTTVGAGGAFSANATLTVSTGSLSIRPFGGFWSTIDLTNNMSSPTAIMGTITMSGGAFHWSAPVNTTFMFADPASGLSGSITLTGAIVADWSLVQVYCTGDGLGTDCPCLNNSLPGGNRGCRNSTGDGARLTTTGTASISSDTFALRASELPASSSGLFLQGTAQVAFGNGAVFGDGLRCVGGTLVRLGAKAITAGLSMYPGASDPSISVKGLVTSAGSTRGYQLWFRDHSGYCIGSTFNLTNGIWVTWLP